MPCRPRAFVEEPNAEAPVDDSAAAKSLITRWEQVLHKIESIVRAADNKANDAFKTRASRFFVLLDRAIVANHAFGITCP